MPKQLKQTKPAVSVTELTNLARSRLDEARALFDVKKYDAAYYLAGYAVELAIKAKICQIFKWPEFPPSPQIPKYCKDISDILYKQLVKTHDLEMLSGMIFCLSGTTTENEMNKANLIHEWKTIIEWDPEDRYQKLGSKTELDTNEMIEAVEKLLGFFL